MDDEEQKIQKLYERNLKAEEHFEWDREGWQREAESEHFRFHATFMKNVFDSGRFKGSKLLEIGGGCTVHNVAAASAHFRNITLSDFLLDHVEALRLWLEGRSGLRQMLEVQAELEGFGDDLEAGRRVIESRIRERVKRVARCDVLSDQVLLDDSGDPETSPPFDVLVSCLCLESAAADYGSFCRVLERLARLLGKGGGLVLMGFLQGSTWRVGDSTYHYLSLDERQLLDALEKAGFGEVDLRTMTGRKKYFERDCFSFDKMYCVAAEKL